MSTTTCNRVKCSILTSFGMTGFNQTRNNVLFKTTTAPLGQGLFDWRVSSVPEQLLCKANTTTSICQHKKNSGTAECKPLCKNVELPFCLSALFLFTSRKATSSWVRVWFCQRTVVSSVQCTRNQRSFGERLVDPCVAKHGETSCV